MMKHMDATILGQTYRLGVPDGGEQALQASVKRVDDAMVRIHDAGKIRARDRIAVLAALNMAFDLGQLEAQLASAQNALAQLQQELAAAHQATEAATSRASDSAAQAEASGMLALQTAEELAMVNQRLLAAQAAAQVAAAAPQQTAGPAHTAQSPVEAAAPSAAPIDVQGQERLNALSTRLDLALAQDGRLF
jgi:cell division protein ZapA